MPVERFRPDLERNRNGFGWVFMGVAVVFIALLAWLGIENRRITVTALVLYALLAGLFALGWRLVFKVRYLFEIDGLARTYSFLWDWKPAGSRPLDALGPLKVEKRVRRVGSEGKRRTIVEYVVLTEAHADADLYVEKTAGKARRRMEALGQAWHLPCRSFGGAVRAADELNVPLHDRLRDDASARRPVSLDPEWGVTIEPLSLGYAVVSRRWSLEPLATSVVVIVVTAIVSRIASTEGMLASLRDREDLMGHAFAALFAVLALVFLWILVQGIRDAFFPGRVLVTDRGVSYRFSGMPFREIEEVTSYWPVEVVGDRKSIALCRTFGPGEATDAIAHEIQRLIIEVAEAYPHARAS
jgi:hypothetical protein